MALEPDYYTDPDGYEVIYEASYFRSRSSLETAGVSLATLMMFVCLAATCVFTGALCGG